MKQSINFLLFIFVLVCFVFVQIESNSLLGHGVQCDAKKIIVDHHNYVRRQIAQGKVPGQPKSSNMKVMIWDDTLAKMAQNYANKMIFKHNPQRKDGRFSVGENLYIFQTTSSKFTGFNWKAAIQSWFDEYKLFKYGSGFSSGTGHYTQLVWANTTHIGCGSSYYKDGSRWYSYLYVCNYGPAGNYIGQNPYKVGKGCKNLCCNGKRCPTKYYGMLC